MSLSTSPAVESPWPVVLRLGPLTEKLDDEAFYRFCRGNRGLRIERTSSGDLAIMSPTGGKSSRLNLRLGARLADWAEVAGGVAFDSSAGFILPNRAARSPDLAWIEQARWDALTPEQQERFPPLCPDFVVEIRSPSDSLAALQEKMREYLENGARLAWLLDPNERRVYVYRPGAELQVVDDPKSLAGDPVLPGFTVDLRRLWA